MKAAGDAGGITLIHCEDLATIECCTTMLDRPRARRSRATSPTAARWRRRRVATERAIAMCRATGAPTYIVHLSSARALAACAAARAEGLPLFVETRPLYLHLTAERYREHEGALYVAQPPLRERADQEALWRGLADGSIDTIASDHAPWTRELKLDPKLDVVHCRSGRRRARHHAAAALHGGRRDRPAVAGAVRGADVDQRRPAVRHVSAQGNDRGRVRRRHRRSGRRASGGRCATPTCFRARATASTRAASSAPGPTPPSAAASWCSRTARCWGSRAAAVRLAGAPRRRQPRRRQPRAASNNDDHAAVA